MFSQRGTPSFCDFQLKRARNVTQLRESHPHQVSKAFLPVPAWTAESTEEFAELLAVPRCIWSATYMAQCSIGLNTAGASAGFPNHIGRIYRPVGVEVVERE